jgi:hypothetical protein
MNDREIILAIRTHCHEGQHERAKFPQPLSRQDACYLVGFLCRALSSILEECDMRSETSDGSRADG